MTAPDALLMFRGLGESLFRLPQAESFRRPNRPNEHSSVVQMSTTAWTTREVYGRVTRELERFGRFQSHGSSAPVK
jgi:hypothetical protein